MSSNAPNLADKGTQAFSLMKESVFEANYVVMRLIFFQLITFIHLIFTIHLL